MSGPTPTQPHRESIELRALKNRRSGSQAADAFNSAGPQDTTFILHEVQPHHTLQGIALQYSTTVAHLKKLNNLTTNDDIHARGQLKIPAARHGLLYSAVHFGEQAGIELKSESLIHTTRNIVLQNGPKSLAAASATSNSAETANNAVLDIEADSDAPDSVAPASESQLFLQKFDQSLATNRQRQEALLREAEGTTSVTPLLVARDASARPWFLPSDWRQLAVFVAAMVLLFPVAVYISEYVEAPNPADHQP
eukprot:m.86499 g.86499  ORF g.86499 m.86499 type:complete len:252 (-) comp8436_c0_seq1:750-1505(-)